MFLKRFDFVFSIFVFAFLAGCGEASRPTASVSGVVTLNGKPFTGAAIHFYNAEIGGGAFNLNENGEFASTEPLTVAEYLISFDRPGPNQGASPKDVTWPADKSGDVPLKYRSSGKSGLVARVAKGDGNRFVFDLVGASSSSKQNAGPAAFDPLPELMK